MTRKCFYSFHYECDSTRAAQVRNIGVVDGSEPALDNNWETLTRGGEAAIKRWIDEELNRRTATIVLVGQNTANRRWINHEIVESWNKRMGVVGIYIHGLKNLQGQVAPKGENPFDYINSGSNTKLSQIARCYNPAGSTSKDCYDWITKHLSNVVEESIRIRNQY